MINSVNDSFIQNYYLKPVNMSFYYSNYSCRMNYQTIDVLIVITLQFEQFSVFKILIDFVDIVRFAGK